MPQAPLDLLKSSFASGACLRLVLSQRRSAARDEFSKVVIRPVTIGGRLLWQFSYHFARQVKHENVESTPAGRRAEQLLTETFVQATLCTAEADYAIRSRADGSWRVSTSPPTKTAVAAAHDRAKSYVIPEGTPCPFLFEIGVMTADGQVRRAMYHKYRQINRFLELVQDVVPALPPDRELNVVDFGCGKSYLTFALHHLLTQVHGRTARIVGLDRQPEVIRTCANLAAKLECHGLSFEQGDIAGYARNAAVDLAVSLHACDTATDAALARAVQWECPVILAVPCCQHELAAQLRIEEFAPLSRHGLLHERLAALATDALRAALLEVHGYATQVVEFIDMEHTPKNVLIRAVRRPQWDETQRTARLAEYRAFRKALGVDDFALESGLGCGDGGGVC